MMSLLLNPRVWIAVGLAALLFFMYANIQQKKVQIALLEGDKTSLQQANAELGKQLLNLAGMIETLKANLVAAKKSISEMQKVKEEANVLRRRIIELQNQPNACEALKVEYEKIASDITAMFNDRVQRKINRDGTNDNRTAPEVLPGPVAPDTNRPQSNAGASG
jgi:chromosome segregation ATPase